MNAPATSTGTLRVVRDGNRYVCECHIAERFVPKKAGFRFDWERKQWWTGDIATAARLREYAAPDVAEEIACWAGEREAAIEASRAASADIEIPAPAGLAYLPYQRAGIAYGMAREGVLIGDEMGLGKTIQAIGIANADPEARAILIVCPASLKLNWGREWQKWCTKGLTIGFAGDYVPSTDVVITNYEQLKKHAAALRARQWDLVIFDECHYLKNPKAQRTAYALGKWDKDPAKVVEPIKARRRVMLTGTPIVNRPVELWSLVRALDPKGLGANWNAFVRRYCGAYETAYGIDTSGASNLDELQDRMRAAFMVRRLKKDVLTELPPKRRDVVVLEADSASTIRAIEEEKAAYARGLAAIEEARAALELAKAESEEVYAAALRRLREVTGVAFTEMSRVRHQVALAKVPVVIEYLKEAIESGPVVVMGWHHDVVEQIAGAFGDAAVYLHGGVTDMRDRQAAVDRFQTDEDCKLFIGTIKAAGVGLTLTRSAHVVFVELDWVPGNVSQAEDRCHRIGQRDSVLVQHLVLDGSLDVRMAQTLISKQEVIDAALDDETKRELAEVTVTAEERAAMDEAIAADADRTKQREERAATQALTRADVAEEAIRLKPGQAEAAHLCLQMLADMDPDHARDINGVGFSKIDNLIGHDLARRGSLTPRQAVLAIKLANKYRRQLPADLVARAKGE